MEEDWAKFKTETKKQLSTFANLTEHSVTAKHLLYDTFDKINDHSFDVITTFRIINQSNNPREIAIVGMMAFLWEYEGSYMTCIDAYCYLLVLNGHDLYDIFHYRYTKSLEEIAEVSISIKIKFLKEHDFEKFIRKEDRKLRNKIAHHDFTVDKSGKVMIENKEVDVGLRFSELVEFTKIVFETFCSCYGEC